MKITLWSILGTLCLVLSGIMTMPFARAAVEPIRVPDLRSITVPTEAGLGTGPKKLAELPLLQETDPEPELDRIALYHSIKPHPYRLMVAMRLGNRLDLLPDAAWAFNGRAAHSAGYLNPAAQSHSGLSEVASSNQLVDASGVFDEDEKVIEEPEEWNDDEVQDSISDPLEPLNRAFFQFNDKLYFWVLKPVARGYKFVVPEPLRVSVRNVFTNLAMPIRAANCLLQGKFRGFGREVLRFFVNSTAGFLGVADVATSGMHLEGQDEDFGQTLGFLGAGPGLFINWPVFGPSSARDTVGMVGDWFADPLNYLVPKRWENVGVKAGDKVNRTSLRLGDYESLKKSALDPYVAVRDAYFQYRKNKIKK